MGCRDFKHIPEGDSRHMFPRFKGENLKKNLDLVEKVEKIAEAKEITTAQLALAYILQLSPMVSALHLGVLTRLEKSGGGTISLRATGHPHTRFIQARQDPTERGLRQGQVDRRGSVLD